MQAAGSAADGYRLTGTRTQLAYGPVADAFLVPAETGSGTTVFVVAAADPGVTVTPLNTTGHGSVAHLELAGTTVGADRVVGGVGEGNSVVDWLRTHQTLGLSAFQLGILARALELTAEYAREREQFDRPIGSFQAVAQRLADGYIDIKGLRLTLTQAAWRLAEDLPSDVDVRTAAFWAAEAGHRVAHTTVHVHGGVGIDTDHPVHRYFLAAKQTEFAVGGATGQLLAHRPGTGRHARLTRDCACSHADRLGAAGSAGRRRRSGRVLRRVGRRGSFISWRNHIQDGADLAALLRARLDPDRPPHVGVLLGNTPFFCTVLVAAALAGSCRSA